MNARNMILVLIAAGLVGAGGYGAYWLGMSRGIQMTRPSSGSAPAESGAHRAGGADPDAGKKVLYWHDPMAPGQKFDKPGKSPFMDMQLVPVYADAGSDEGRVSVSSGVQQNLGIRVAEVTRDALAPVIEAVGSVAYNERDAFVVQARSNGYVEKLHVRALLDPVRKGQALAELYVPDWVAAQEEYLSVKRMSGAGMETVLDGARQRMRLAGMTEDQIRLVETSGKVHARLTVTAPAGGVVAELGAREGMTVAPGTLLFRINGLDTVWVNAEVSESQASLVHPGNRVEARAPALPGTVFKGRVSSLLPDVNAATRTLKARVELANPGNRLVPGMFATISFSSAARKEILLVPTEAVIQTGKRTVVIVAQSDGKFSPVDVETGIEDGGRTEIRKGLEAGQKVVVSGQFLIDSESSLRATTTRMGDSAMPEAAKAGGATHHGQGTVTGVDPVQGRLELDHGPIPSLKWPPMKMEFPVADKSQLTGTRKGDAIEFELRGEPDRNGEYIIEKFGRVGSKP